MGNRLSFGIGCFQFVIKKTPPFKFRSSVYIKELRTALQLISNIDKIDIHCEDAFKNLSFDVMRELQKQKLEEKEEIEKEILEDEREYELY